MSNTHDTIFVDTNILLDVLLKRQPHIAGSATIWTMAERREHVACVSTLSFANSYYIVTKLEDRHLAKQSMKLLLSVFEVVSFDSKILDQAMGSDMKDFEDAIQFFSAVSVGADCLITRNRKHFPSGTIPIQTPERYLATRELKED